MASTSRCNFVVAKNLLSSQEKSGEHVASHEKQNYTDSVEQIYYKKLVEYDDQHSGSNRKPWTEERISEVIADLKNIRMTMKKKSVDYYWISKYDICTTENDEYLTFKKRIPSDPILRIVPREQYFDILSEVHIACGHGGRDKMLHIIKTKYYIPKKAIEIFVSLCPVCGSKRNATKSDNISRTIPRNFNARGQFEIINFQSMPDGDYKWLLNYQNKDTKFTILRPLKTSSAKEIASELLIIFLTLGAPHSLQSELGKDVLTSVVKELVMLWPDCGIVQRVDNCFDENDRNVKTMLQSWMNENNSLGWSVGCYFIQYYKNTSFDSILGKSPYEESFRYAPECSLRDSSISMPTVTNCKIEEQLSINKEQRIPDFGLEIKVEHTDLDDMNTDSNETVEPAFTENDQINAYKCKICNSTVHIICGIIDDDQGQRLKVSCYVCKSEQNVELLRNKELKRVAKEVVPEPPKKIPTLDIGQSVIVVVPKAYRGPLETKSIKGKIVDISNGVYRIATKIGTIKNWFSRHDLQYTEIDYGDISELSVSMEDAVTSQPPSDSKAFQKCSCKPVVNQCHNNRCICYKNKTLCGPKCHQGLVCVNT